MKTATTPIFLQKLAISSIFGVLTATNLSAQNVALGEIVVTSKSASSLAQDTAGSYSIIKSDAIEGSGGATSLVDLLKDTVGVAEGINSGSQFNRSTINIRGTESKHTLVLIDGKRVSASDALIGLSDFGYNWLPLNAIDRIEVVRGPMSSLYGSSALGGVVNMITKKPDKTLEGEAGVKFGLNSAEHGGEETEFGIGLRGKISNSLAASLFLQKKDIEPVLESSSLTIAETEGKDISHGALGVWYDIDASQSINLFWTKGGELRDNVKYKKYYDIDREHYSVEYKKRFENIGVSLRYYASKLDAHSEDSSLLYTHKMEDNVFSSEFSIASFDKNFIILGFENRQEKYRKSYDYKSVAKPDFKNEVDYKSAYLQDELEIAKGALFTFGARYDKHENFGGELSPKAYLIYKLDENNIVKGGYGHGFNAPSLTQGSNSYVFSYPITTTPPLKFYRFYGNEDLKPETSDSFELGYEYKKNDGAVKATIFYTKIKDLIAFKDVDTTIVKPITYYNKLYSNIDKSRIQGAELECDFKNVASLVDVRLDYSYLDAIDETTKKELQYRPKHKANLKILSKLPYEIDGSFRLSYVGKQYNGEKYLQEYATLGLQASKKLAKGITARVGVDNLMDERLDEEYDFSIKNRVVWASFEYKF